MLMECTNCGFYVFDKEIYCLNCGAEKYEDNTEDSEFYFNRNLTVVLTCISAVAFTVLIHLLRDKEGDFSSFFLYLILGSVLGFIFSSLISMFVSSKISSEIQSRKQNSTQATQNLINYDVELDESIYRFNEKYREIESLLNQTNPITNESPTTLKLLEARKNVLSEIAFATLQKERIEIIRLQNSLRPVLYNSDSKERRAYLNSVNENIFRLKNIKLSLTNDYAIEFPENTLREKESFLAQLDNTNQSFLKLREKLLEENADFMLEDREISPFEDSLKAEKLFEEIEIFNIQTVITNFKDFGYDLEKKTITGKF